MGKKLTLEIVKERLKDINPMVEIIDDVYKGSKEKMKCRCLKEGCGHEFETTWDHLKTGQKCRRCSGYIPLTIEIIKDKVKDISPTVQILDKEYLGSHTNIRCKCLVDGCGWEWEANARTLMKGHKCANCAGNVKLTFKEAQYRVKSINPMIQMTEEGYKNVRSKIKCRCLVEGCNHEWITSTSKLFQGQGCKKCAGLVILTLENVKDRLREASQMIEIIDDKYINSYTKMKCKCLVEGCGNIWMSSWDNLLQRSSYPECSKALMGGDGVYNPTLARRHKYEWLKIPAVLYIIKCVGNNETFYKIGITKNSVKRRFSCNKTMPYEYEPVMEFSYSLYHAILIEKELHQLNSPNKYIPNLRFDGRQECFSEININQIEDFLVKKKVGED